MIKTLIFLLLCIGFLHGVWMMFASSSELPSLVFVSRGMKSPSSSQKGGVGTCTDWLSQNTCILGPVSLASEAWRKMMSPAWAMGFPYSLEVRAVYTSVRRKLWHRYTYLVWTRHPWMSCDHLFITCSDLSTSLL